MLASARNLYIKLVLPGLNKSSGLLISKQLGSSTQINQFGSSFKKKKKKKQEKLLSHEPNCDFCIRF